MSCKILNNIVLIGIILILLQIILILLVLMVYFKIGISIINMNMLIVICNISSYIYMCCFIYCIIVYIKKIM